MNLLNFFFATVIYVSALAAVLSTPPALADLSIYVLGDDFTGGNFDSVLADIANLNKKGARINGLSFIRPKASTDRFGTLMREISQVNDGSFISLN